MKKKLRKKNFEKTMDKFAKKSNELFKNKRQVICCDYCGRLIDKKDAIIIYDISKNENEYFCKECDLIHNSVCYEEPIPLGEN